MSDIVICRMWVPIEVKPFYNPVLSLLEAEGPESWKGMRNIADIRKDAQIPIPVNKDSLYKPIVRVPREFRKLTIPTKLQDSLPFASKPKLEPRVNPTSYAARRAVILEPEDKKKRAMVQMLSTIRNDKMAKRKSAKALRSQQHAKAGDRTKEKFSEVHKEEKKRKYRDSGKEAVHRENKKKARVQDE